ncbi:Ecp2 effector protein, partial [Coniochaeta sp. 2T2.1]
DKCGDSSFHDSTSPDRPTISDCLVIAKNIASGGHWEVEAFGSDVHQLVQFGTCAFGVQAVPPFGDAFFYIGNSDIIDVINDSIRRFGMDGVVGAWGEMHCGALLLGSGVRWRIYHN